MKMRKFILIVGIFAALLPFSAHADITIGLAGPFTGEEAFFGEQIKHGAEQAVEDINAAGGVLGQKLVLKSGDDACDPKQGVAVANQMVSDGIKFVVGHVCSGASIPASHIYNEENILMITPSSSNPALTDTGFKNVFRACGRDDQQGPIIGRYILAHYKGKKVALINDQSAWGAGMAEQVKKTINAGGMKAVMDDAYTPTERDFSALISHLKQAGVEVAFIGGFHTEVGLIMRQIKEQNLKIQVIGGDALVTDQFWKVAGSAAEGVLMTFGSDPRNKPEAKAALETLRKSGFEPEGYTFYAYAAVQAVAEGIKRAGAPDPVKAAAALHATPVQTIIGKLTFDAKGDVTGPTYVMYRWHDGKYAEIEK